MQNFSNYNKIILDLGCGDGKQVYRLARSNPDNYYFGIDSNEKGFEETLKKTLKKESKGGLKNLAFIKASAEELPDMLNGQIDEILINFPWGSLLEGIILVEESIIRNIKMVAKTGATIEIFTTYDDKFEESFKTIRQLPELSLEFINKDLREKYLQQDIDLIEAKQLSEEEKVNLDSPWGKKILSSRVREVFYLKFRINK